MSFLGFSKMPPARNVKQCKSSFKSTERDIWYSVSSKENHMNTDNRFDPKKRRTLKILTGLTTTGMLAGVPVIANAQFIATSNSGDIIDCKLISRADLSRAYLLMHNQTNHQIAAARFSMQSVLFDDTTLNMAEAYVEPIIIPPHDRVMVRLNLEAGLQADQTNNNIINMNLKTQFLPQGTRVVDLKVRMNNGVATIADYPVPV